MLRVLIPTFNRAKVLHETLTAIERTTYEGDWEIVVIDNNSDDGTEDVVSSFSSKLPIRILRELRPGKNCALNRALEATEPADITVFADDDITPRSDWILRIVEVSEMNPEIQVFGARIVVGWPGKHEPEWARARWLRELGFAEHDFGDREFLYSGKDTPLGPCYWIKRGAMLSVPGFDESIGPRPTDRIMGSETSHLLALAACGFRMLHCPDVAVIHRIQVAECRIGALWKRGYRSGRGQTRLYGLHRQNLKEGSFVVWVIALFADCLVTGGRFGLGVLIPSKRVRAERTVKAMIRFGRLDETRRLFMKQRSDVE